MNIEQMKLLVDALGQAGGEAKSVVMFWLVRDGLIALGTGILIACGIFCAYRLIKKGIDYGGGAAAFDKLYKEVMGESGWCFTASAVERVANKLKEDK